MSPVVLFLTVLPILPLLLTVLCAQKKTRRLKKKMRSSTPTRGTGGKADDFIFSDSNERTDTHSEVESREYKRRGTKNKASAEQGKHESDEWLKSDFGAPSPSPSPQIPSIPKPTTTPTTESHSPPDAIRPPLEGHQAGGQPAAGFPARPSSLENQFPSQEPLQQHSKDYMMKACSPIQKTRSNETPGDQKRANGIDEKKRSGSQYAVMATGAVGYQRNNSFYAKKFS